VEQSRILYTSFPYLNESAGRANNKQPRYRKIAIDVINKTLKHDNERAIDYVMDQ
jgi:hypothetical protein